jgi:hypothetical protein
MGTLVATVYSAYLGYGYLGLLGFASVNVGLAVFWNKARKSARADSLEDRLSFERMDEARDWWVTKNGGDD